MTLTPMIIATFPILIGLGVDYALHMVNRIEEVRRKRIDAAVEENERRRRKGLTPNEVPDMWDPDFYRFPASWRCQKQLELQCSFLQSQQ